MPTVSVIMNCYNGSEYLREALDSIYAQTVSDWEIVFWDNASVDDSANIAKRYDARLRYFVSDQNMPLGRARNSALREARGEFVAFLDTDDEWMPTKLEKQIPLLLENPRVGLVHADVVCTNIRTGRRYRHFARLGHRPPRGSIFQYLLSHNAIGMPTVVLRREALYSQAEWFDESFEIYPDFDLFRRIAHDWECDFVNETLAEYRIHDRSSSTRNHQRAARELELTVEKFCSLYPSFETIFPNENRYLRAMVAYQRGKSLWRDGKAREARSAFLSYWREPKLALAYIATLLPYQQVERLWTYYNQFRGSH